MFDFVKKALFTGIGVALITKDKAEELVKEFIDQGSLTEQEGRKLVQDIMEQAEKSKKDLEGWVDAYIEKAVTRLDLAKKSDLDELKVTINEMKQRIENSHKE